MQNVIESNSKTLITAYSSKDKSDVKRELLKFHVFGTFVAPERFIFRMEEKTDTFSLGNAQSYVIKSQVFPNLMIIKHERHRICY